MKPAPSPFESTAEFAEFRSTVFKLLKVSKSDLDKAVKDAKEHSSRKNNPLAPGRKRTAKSPDA